MSITNCSPQFTFHIKITILALLHLLPHQPSVDNAPQHSFTPTTPCQCSFITNYRIRPTGRRSCINHHPPPTQPQSSTFPCGAGRPPTGWPVVLGGQSKQASTQVLDKSTNPFPCGPRETAWALGHPVNRSSEATRTLPKGQVGLCATALCVPIVCKWKFIRKLGGGDFPLLSLPASLLLPTAINSTLRCKSVKSTTGTTTPSAKAHAIVWHQSTCPSETPRGAGTRQPLAEEEHSGQPHPHSVFHPPRCMALQTKGKV